MDPRTQRLADELIGKQVGELTVLRIDGKKGVSTAFLCQCSCGNLTRRAGHDLKRTDKTGYQSCGCRKYLKGKENPNWSGCGDISGFFWSNVKFNAKHRNLKVSLTIEEAWELFLWQERRCALTGWELSFNNPKTASLDRIDSSLNYTLDNVQWTHKEVNKIKWQLHEDRFVEICRAVAEFRENDIQS